MTLRQQQTPSVHFTPRATQGQETPLTRRPHPWPEPDAYHAYVARRVLFTA